MTLVTQIAVTGATFAILTCCRCGNPDDSNPKIAQIEGLTPVFLFDPGFPIPVFLIIAPVLASSYRIFLCLSSYSLA